LGKNIELATNVILKDNQIKIFSIKFFAILYLLIDFKMNRNWGSDPFSYKKGSFHNKLGMFSLWLFIGLASIQIILLIFS
tara:strand:- start:229 stop:468 length:240 start_codon:yes stop_codon:yes gene_type:complete